MRLPTRLSWREMTILALCGLAAELAIFTSHSAWAIIAIAALTLVSFAFIWRHRHEPPPKLSPTQNVGWIIVAALLALAVNLPRLIH